MARETNSGAASTPNNSLSLISNERFADLLRTFQERGVRRDEFEGMAMPEGFSHDEVWDALMQIRRSQAVHYYDFCELDGKKISQWFTETKRIEGMLRELSARTQKGSSLDSALNERNGRRFIVKPLIEEAVASAACDSLDIDYETARSVITGERAAVNAAESFVSNMHALLLNLNDEDERPITIEFIEGVYAALLEGIDPSSFTSKIPWGSEWPEDPLSREEGLLEICALANGELVDEAEHPIITAQKLICKCWKAAPFQNCNYTIGSLLSRVYLKRHGYPVFTFIPSSSMTLMWKSGAYANDSICPYGMSGNVSATDRDWTIYWESCLKLMLMELDTLEQHVLSIKVHDDKLLENLKADRTLNHRQIEVLSKAILVPETSFRISDHQEKYGLAYSTARSDLSTLVEIGYLEMRYESKAQVFIARFDMKQAMARQYAARK